MFRSFSPSQCCEVFRCLYKCLICLPCLDRSNNSVTLWLGYLHFKSGHFASFSVEKQRLVFSRCIEVLRCRRLERMQERDKEDRARGVFITVSNQITTITTQFTRSFEAMLVMLLENFIVCMTRKLSVACVVLY